MQRAKSVSVEDILKRTEAALAEHRFALPGKPHVGGDPMILGMIIPDWQGSEVDLPGLFKDSTSLAREIGGAEVTPALLFRPDRITMGYFPIESVMFKALR